MRLMTVLLIGALALAGCQAGDSLAGPTWAWTAVEGAAAGGEAVAPAPGAYTIEFGTDGTVAVQADCNRLGGTYAAGIPVDLHIEVGTASAATTTCADPALDHRFLELLGQVESFSTGGGQLKLELANSAGTLRFAIAGS